MTECVYIMCAGACAYSVGVRVCVLERVCMYIRVYVCVCNNILLLSILCNCVMYITSNM